MYDGAQATSQTTAAIYFISCFVFGNYIVLSLFLAILLGNFEIVEPEEDEETTKMVNEI